jgi:iron(III) transport system ATP-binding protein
MEKNTFQTFENFNSMKVKSPVKWESEDLVLKNIIKTFDDGKGNIITAVDNISIKIAKGEFATLLGPSGCGKTTTLRMVAGFESPDNGDILLGNKKINNIPPFARNMPMVFQSYALFPHLTIFENIAYGLKIRKFSKNIIKNDVEMILQLVNLAGLENRYPGEISGGQQQRVALARALVLKPKIILFDEPLSNLDAKLRIQTRMEIKRVQQMLGITTLYVTHDQAEALSMSDKIVLMNKGRIEQSGSPEEIYNKPKSVFVADFIVNANFIDAVIGKFNNNTITVNIQNNLIDIPKDNSSVKFNQGEEVYLAIKPEAVKISKGNSRFKGKICSKFFLGSSMEYEIEFDDSVITSIQPNSDELDMNIPVGKEVSIEFNKDYFHILKKE